MILTLEQETNLIRKYDKVVWSTVHRFKRRMTAQWNNQEDLHQEALIVLLQHIRSCESEEEIGKIPIRDMINAMCRYNIGEQVVSMPRRTTDFSQKISGAVQSVDYTELDRDDRYMDMTIDQAVENMTMKSFLESLTDDDRKVVDMKIAGMKNREVARSMGVTDVDMTRRLKKIRSSYQKYVS